ncbi:MAG: hypothetical protein HY222_03185 [Thaumarchaeota archaeon]|nr:hypothetical protein [Nitrososphaerota archaeon]MBI3641379.1 hypothetical protein [Nitrososphaerota archaeon]
MKKRELNSLCDYKLAWASCLMLVFSLDFKLLHRLSSCTAIISWKMSGFNHIETSFVVCIETTQLAVTAREV